MRAAFLSFCSVVLAGTTFAQQAAPVVKPPVAVTPVAPSAAAPAVPAPAHPLTDAQATQLMALLGADKTKDQVKGGLVMYFHSRLPFAPQDVSDDLNQSLDKMDLNTPITTLYKSRISTEDAEAMIAFCKTAAGKAMIAVLPDILQQTQQTSMQVARKTAQDVVDRHRAEIDAAAKKYREEHAPKAPPSLNTPATPGAAPNAAPAAKPAAPSSSTPATPQAPQQ